MPAAETVPYEHERNEMRVHIISAFARVLERDADTWARPELGEDMNFMVLRPIFVDVLQHMQILISSPLERLPTEAVRAILIAYNDLETPLRAIGRFVVVDPEHPNRNPVEARKQVVDEFTKAANEFLMRTYSVTAYALSLKHTLQAEPHEQVFRGAEQRIFEIMSAVDEQKHELDAIVSASREVVAQVGISQHAVHFKEEAVAFEQASRRWLIATGFLGVTAFAAGVANLVLSYVLPAPLTNSHGVQIVVAKLLIFSLLVSATIWCGRAYRASRHNFVVNRHRQNALSSFETFAHSTDDPQTKNAVLLQATQSIFSPQISGYTLGEAEVSTSPQLIELVRTIAPGK